VAWTIHDVVAISPLRDRCQPSAVWLDQVIIKSPRGDLDYWMDRSVGVA